MGRVKENIINQFDEVWMPIVGYEEHYMVSNRGRIKSIDRHIVGSNSKSKLFPESIKFQSFDKANGYFRCQLTKDTIKKTIKVHRLVAMAFIQNPENKKCVNHISGIKTDNSVENLEWCTHSENTIHAFNLGLRTPAPHKSGSENKYSKTVFQYSLTHKLVNKWSSCEELKHHGYDPKLVSRVCNGFNITHKNYIWKYQKI